MLSVMSTAISKRRRAPIGLAIGVMLSWLPSFALSQTQPAQIAGLVRDAAGVVIPGTKITLTSETNSATQSAATNADGRYAFASAKPGPYTLAAEAAGFKREVRTHVIVEDSAHPVTADFTLSVAGPLVTVRVGDAQDFPLQTEGKSPSPPVKYSDDAQMKPSGMNTAIDSGGHSSPGPARTNILVQGVSALKNETASANSGTSAEHVVADAASEDSLFDQGNKLLLGQQLDPAIEVFGRGALRYPRSTKLAIGLGVALYARGRYDKAIEALCAASDLSPSDPRPYLFLARIDEGLAAGSDEVTKRLERYLRLQPQSALAHYYYAMDLLRSRRDGLEQIESLLKSAIALDPALAGAHLALANAYAEEHNYANAIQEYQQAIKLQPDLADAHYRLAQAYTRAGEPALKQTELDLYERLRKSQTAETERRRSEVERFVDEVKTAPKQ
jgi:tetratricopeptide (TPR) repeat protein